MSAGRALAALLLAAAPAPLAAQAMEAPPPRFDPLRFFTGATEGRGTLRIVLHHARDVRVHGTGHRDPDGTLVLDQQVVQHGRPATHRRWRLREAAPGRYTGTLTDAAGPVTGEVAGRRLHLSYRAKGGVRIDQWLDASPDGQVAHNWLRARKLGVVVAHLDETIRRVE
jgi:hypothetical protein